MRYVYDPGIGTLTEWSVTLDAARIEDVRLVANATVGAAVWYEAGETVVVADPAMEGLPEGAPRPVGWTYMHLVPVTWLRLTPAS